MKLKFTKMHGAGNDFVVIDAIHQEQAPWRARADEWLADPKKVHWIVEVGAERARAVARKTLRDVRSAMGLDY